MSGTYSAPAFGVLPSGFVKKLTSDVELDIESALRTNVDPNLDLSPTEPMGQIKSAVAAAAAEIWEVLDTVYAANDPGAAEGQLLDTVCAITGTKRVGQTYSLVVCNANVNAGTTIPLNTIANVSGQPANTWTMVGVGTKTSDYTKTALVAGGAGTYSTVWQSTVPGPSVANSGTLTVVPSPPVGLNSLTNPNDAVLGSLVEDDSDLRVRRQNELSAAGSATVDAIRAALLEVPGVVNAFVYENTGDTTDGFGRPPHSIEGVLFDGVSPAASNNAIAQTLWTNKPAGVPYFSATGDSGTATDSQGATHTMAFSRAQIVEVYLAYTITTGVGWDPVNGPAAVKAAAAQYAADNLSLGSLVDLQDLAVVIKPTVSSKYGVKGVLNSSLAMDVVPSPVATADIQMSSRQYPHIVTTHITVNGA